jgi:hypothetical protein
MRDRENKATERPVPTSCYQERRTDALEYSASGRRHAARHRKPIAKSLRAPRVVSAYCRLSQSRQRYGRSRTSRNGRSQNRVRE